MSFNIGARTKAVKALSSGTVQTGTTNGDAIDLAQNNSNFRDVLFIITSGTLTDGTYTVSVEESDASGSGYAAIGSHRLVTAAPSFAAMAAWASSVNSPSTKNGGANSSPIVDMSMP